MSDRDDDKVGYKKPPKHSRFKPGKSGNPKGRPKGSKNLSTILEQCLAQKVQVVEKGRKKDITMQDFIVRKMLNDAAAGDAAARRDVLRLMADLKDPPESGIKIVFLDEADRLA